MLSWIPYLDGLCQVLGQHNAAIGQESSGLLLVVQSWSEGRGGALLHRLVSAHISLQILDLLEEHTSLSS